MRESPYEDRRFHHPDALSPDRWFSPRKRKGGRDMSDEEDSSKEELIPIEHRKNRNGYWTKRHRESSPSALAELMEHCILEQSPNSGSIVDETPDGIIRVNWMRVHVEVQLILEQVDTQTISAVILHDLAAHAEELSTTKGFHLYYKKLFGAWTPSDGTRLGHIFVGLATQIWMILLRDRCFFFDVWMAFLMRRRIQFISRDQWNLFFEFCLEYHERGFDHYDERAAWPTLMDDFVDFYRAINPESSTISTRAAQ
eukprot:TRINITY_DN8767_c0_g1_i1.p1 TRINITY_DN8767_c0_g1~~TRINITY_DN8767_c0_g1_i1.p1  ORF type:complete len:277 (-),score=44.42 TRINITY_DN8767_c0_g1_i1:8-772(-)